MPILGDGHRWGLILMDSWGRRPLLVLRGLLVLLGLLDGRRGLVDLLRTGRLPIVADSPVDNLLEDLLLDGLSL